MIFNIFINFLIFIIFIFHIFHLLANSISSRDALCYLYVFPYRLWAKMFGSVTDRDVWFRHEPRRLEPSRTKTFGAVTNQDVWFRHEPRRLVPSRSIPIIRVKLARNGAKVIYKYNIWQFPFCGGSHMENMNNLNMKRNEKWENEVMDDMRM